MVEELTFFRIKQYLKKIYVSGTGANDIYVSTLWCYEQLQFLDQGAPVRMGDQIYSILMSQIAKMKQMRET